MKKIIYLILLTAIVSCTKEIDEDIFVGVEEEVLIDDTPEIDPETGEPIVDPEEEMDPEEEVDPSLSDNNTVSNWSVLSSEGVELVYEDITAEGNVVALVYPLGTTITNLTIRFSIAETASVVQATTGLNFEVNDGLKVFDIVAENGEINTYAFEITQGE